MSSRHTMHRSYLHATPIVSCMSSRSAVPSLNQASSSILVVWLGCVPSFTCTCPSYKLHFYPAGCDHNTHVIYTLDITYTHYIHIIRTLYITYTYYIHIIHTLYITYTHYIHIIRTLDITYTRYIHIIRTLDITYTHYIHIMYAH